MNATIARKHTAGSAQHSNAQAIDSLVLGKTAPSSVASAPEVSTELKSAVDKWFADHAGKPGFRTGSSYAPEQMRETIEISSALQLPKILAKLHGQDAGNIRLQFPQPDSSVLPPEQTAAIRQEQTAIHAFLRNSHGKPLDTLLNEVKDLIARSASLQQGINESRLPKDMTAEQWIAATVGEKLQQITKHPQQLAVSDVVEIASQKIAQVKPALDIALNESVSSSRGLIVTIPERRDAKKISELKEVLKALVEAKRASGSTDEQLERIKVWVGPTKQDLINGPQPGSACKKVKEFSLLEFLKDNSAASAVKKKSSVSADTQTEKEFTSASSTASAAKASEKSRAVVTPAADSPLQASTPNLDDLYFQALVTPPRDPTFSFNTLETETYGVNTVNGKD